MTDPRHDLGMRAEGIVAGWLDGLGWQVLARRWRSVAGELDLVCLDPDGALVGVEVKLRRTGRAGSGAESLDPRRVARLRGALATYAMTHRTPSAIQPRGLRLDLVVLTPAGAGLWRARRLPAIDAW